MMISNTQYHFTSVGYYHKDSIANTNDLQHGQFSDKGYYVNLVFHKLMGMIDVFSYGSKGTPLPCPQSAWPRVEIYPKNYPLKQKEYYRLCGIL